MPEQPKAKYKLGQKVSFKDDLGYLHRGRIITKGYAYDGWRYRLQHFPTNTGWMREKEIGKKVLPTKKRKSFFEKKKRYFK